MIEVGMGGDQFGLGAAGPAAHMPFAQERVRGAVAMAAEFRRLPRAVEIGRDHERGIQRPNDVAQLPHLTNPAFGPATKWARDGWHHRRTSTILPAVRTDRPRVWTKGVGSRR